jgi:1,4-alpha-glucan branching enzyme
MTIAEESTAWPMVSRPTYLGGLGFGFKWNMGWMHDLLDYMSRDPAHRKYHHNQLTFGLLYAWHENFILPLSHDEVVHGKGSLHGKMPGDDWQKFANLRCLLGYMWAHPGKKLLFMGGEIGQIGEWNFERQVTWPLLDDPLHAALQAYVAEVNRLYVSEAALHQVDDHWDGFQWIDFEDAASSVTSFLRRARDPEDRLAIVANFTPMPREDYRVRVPGAGRWSEVLNSDDERWGGSGVGQPGGVEAAAVGEDARDGLTHELTLRLPPLGVVWMRAER